MRNWKRVVISLVLCVTMFASGCWGLVLYGRPGPGRNQGKIDWGVVILDILTSPLICLTIDACAGTLRRPEGERSIWSELDQKRIDEYKRLGYREGTGSMFLRETLKIDVRPEDAKANGGKKLRVVWTSNDGSARELYSGLVREAHGVEISTRKCSGAGKLEVMLEGQEAVAWNTRSAGASIQYAAK